MSESSGIITGQSSLFISALSFLALHCFSLFDKSFWNAWPTQIKSRKYFGNAKIIFHLIVWFWEVQQIWVLQVVSNKSNSNGHFQWICWLFANLTLLAKCIILQFFPQIEKTPLLAKKLQQKTKDLMHLQIEGHFKTNLPFKVIWAFKLVKYRVYILK